MADDDTPPAADQDDSRPVTDGERIAIASLYLEALLTHDSSAVPLAPAAVRYEAGMKTGFSGAHLHTSLDKGAQYRLVQDINSIEWTAGPQQVVAEYQLDAGLLGRRLLTVQITETFTIPTHDPRIHRINAHIRLPKTSLGETIRGCAVLVNNAAAHQWRKLR